MATLTTGSQTDGTGPPILPRVPSLENGDHLSRAEFELRYAAMPRLKKAELIEGVVHVPSPISFPHSGGQVKLGTWIGTYAAQTPGVLPGSNGTVRLDQDNEPQPDVFLMIDAACGGQARVDEDRFVAGAPELVAEVAATSASYDLHSKLRAYRRNGVREYLVWRVLDGALDWFVLREGRFDPVPPGDEGVIRSATFPGLWLDVEALLAGDMARVLAVLQQGLATPEHAAFCGQLAARRAAAPR
jgi:Uma2 family endonuclease